MRGEHSAVRTTDRKAHGSSPRARGTPAEAKKDFARDDVHPRVRGEHPPNRIFRPRRTRFIPACAGNTRRNPRLARGFPVHPRVRGEHPARRIFATWGTGSSPRARGTLDLGTGLDARYRFIPACAGNTSRSPPSSSSSPVHPRVRGEHPAGLRRGADDDGSSPRARGTPQNGESRITSHRFIPACAGNTQRKRVPSAR